MFGGKMLQSGGLKDGLTSLVTLMNWVHRTMLHLLKALRNDKRSDTPVYMAPCDSQCLFIRVYIFNEFQNRMTFLGGGRACMYVP